ncbi:DUF262 domain-containing protein [Brachybacterium sp. AOP29-B2-41]|uniref:DUF262 domain-containing protein n=1 Tax=Brachybacterium sp. AOP29-B2-41 TaxID=3457704 RepID=UPI0040343953
MRRRPNTQTIQWFLENHATGQLDLDPPYQRRSVWNEAYRRYYIDSILRDYPSPAIYLQIETQPGLPTTYHVIDGKQRLETLIAFTKDEFNLGGHFSGEGYADAYYSDLPEGMKEDFADYVLSVENISRTSEEEIKSAFERLNKNTAKLNAQELRKAQFGGHFIQRMDSLAQDPFWSSIGVASRARISRMLDVEYVSEIYLLTAHGIMDGTSSVLDLYYAKYDEGIPAESDIEPAYQCVMDWLRELDFSKSGSRWTNLGDFYSLWAAVKVLSEQNELPNYEDAQTRLREFDSRLKKPTSPEEKSYYDAVRQGTNKEASRSIRARIIAGVLVGKAFEE